MNSIHHKGISPLIAAVLLIAFTMTVSGLVGPWMTEVIAETQQTTSDDTTQLMEASKARISVAQTRYDDSSGNLTVSIQNKGSAELENFTATVQGTEIVQKQINHKLEPGEIHTFEITTDEPKKIDISSKTLSVNTEKILASDNKSSSGETTVFIPNSAEFRFAFEDSSDSTTAVDSWGNNDSTIEGASYTTNSSVGETALHFDGADDRVTTNIEDSLDSFSWSVWINFEGSSGNEQPIISTRGSQKGGGIRERGNNEFDFYIYDQNAGRFKSTSTSSSPTDVWIHLVGTLDTDGNVLLYENGTQVDSNSIGSYEKGNNYRIGQRADGSNNADKFPGIIDDVRVYSKALSATEVSNLYNSGSIEG